MPNTKWCAWDIEVATPFPDDGNWLDVLPLGITCAAIATSESRIITFSGDPDKHTKVRPARMTRTQCLDMLLVLMIHEITGYTVVSWNGLGFDLRVLCEELLDPDDQLTRSFVKGCQLLARHHVDLGWLMHCKMGYMIGLDTAANALQVQGKAKGMSGSLAPLLWTGEGDPTEEDHEMMKKLGVLPGTAAAQELCLDYVRQDAVATSNVMRAMIATQSFHWTTGKGTQSRKAWKPDRAPDGKLMTVWQAMQNIREPDTSWQENPRSRGDHIDWTSDPLLWQRKPGESIVRGGA